MFIKFSDKTKRITVKTSNDNDSDEKTTVDFEDINLNEFNDLDESGSDNRRINILKNHMKNDSKIK